MHLFQLYLVVSAALFFLGSSVALGPIAHFAKARLPKLYRRHSMLKKLTIVGSVELAALSLFMGYACLTFDPIVDRVQAQLMLMVLRHLVVAGLIQCVAWPVIRWLLARKTGNPNIHRSLLTVR